MGVRVRLKGLNYKTKRLANGSLKTYYWAWRGGPSLPGKPGDPEFMAAYNAAIAKRVVRPAEADTLLSVLNAYQASAKFDKLAPRTREDYAKQIIKIEAEFRDYPLLGLNDSETTHIFSNWRDKLAKASGARQADYAWTVLSGVLTWAKKQGLVRANPCERGGKLYDGSRADIIWSKEQRKAFYDSAPAHLRLAFMLALLTGQREGDCLQLTWDAYDGSFIRLRQSKTGMRVTIPLSPSR